ncbi:MAG: competence/damage-inducible protein A [bacterium]|nr:competence/damage-inducible protein A [bacterium]
MNAEIISVGTELTTGAVVDTNSAWLSQRLVALGVTVVRHTTVCDDQVRLRDAIRRAADSVDLVMVNGGLGPTRDDLTRFALAEAMECPLEPHAEARRQLESLLARMERPCTEANLIQTQIPRHADIVENPVGTAPGIRAQVGSSLVICLPGVPRELKVMFSSLETTIRTGVGTTGAALAVRSLHTFGSYEADLGARIERFMTPGRNPAVGTTASGGVISIRIVARESDQAAADALADRDERDLRMLLGSLVYGAGAGTLESVVARLLNEGSLTVSTAESCTGGLLAKRLTDVSGSSAYLLRGYVTYSNLSKTELVGVPARLIEAHGAVSDPVARAMASGCRAQARSDWAISTTGIAGPGGGSTEKPVGLVYIALADAHGVQVQRCRFGAHLGREGIRDRTCKTALDYLRRRLIELRPNLDRNAPSTA